MPATTSFTQICNGSYNGGPNLLQVLKALVRRHTPPPAYEPPRTTNKQPPHTTSEWPPQPTSHQPHATRQPTATAATASLARSQPSPIWTQEQVSQQAQRMKGASAGPDGWSGDDFFSTAHLGALCATSTTLAGQGARLAARKTSHTAKKRH